MCYEIPDSCDFPKINKNYTILKKTTKNCQKEKLMKKLTDSEVGPAWEARYCFKGPADLNSLLGVIIQNPVDFDSDELMEIQP